MAQHITTLNEIRANNPSDASIDLADLLYFIHGTGSDRDRAYTVQELWNFLKQNFGDTVINGNLTVYAPIDSSNRVMFQLSENGLNIQKQQNIMGNWTTAGNPLSYQYDSTTNKWILVTDSAEITNLLKEVKLHSGAIIGSNGNWRIVEGERYGVLNIEKNNDGTWETIMQFGFTDDNGGAVTLLNGRHLFASGGVITNKVNGVANGAGNPQKLELFGDVTIEKDGSELGGNLSVAGDILTTGSFRGTHTLGGGNIILLNQYTESPYDLTTKTALNENTPLLILNSTNEQKSVKVSSGFRFIGPFCVGLFVKYGGQWYGQHSKRENEGS